MLDILVLDGDRAEQALHDELSLLLILKVVASRRNRALKSLNGYFCELDMLTVNIADRGVQDLTDLLSVQVLVNVHLEELAHHAQRLDRSKSVLEIGLG